MSNEKLAINGGEPIVTKDFKFKVWPQITKTDEEFVLASLRQNKHAWGPNCVELQNEWSKWNGNKYALATNSGTAALHMALCACGIGPGSEVITTTTSWTSSATSILHHNGLPRFSEIDWETFLIDPSRIEENITENTKAILVVHYFGLACDMDPIMEIAKKHNLYVIEDACQAHGALYKGKKVGTIGHCSAFSLNQYKNFSAGEGGLFVTDDKKMLEDARALMNFGEMRAPEDHRDYHSYGMGWMYRMSDLNAAWARARLRVLDRTQAEALHNWKRLHKGLEDLKGCLLPVSNETQTTCGYAFVIRVIPEKMGINVSFSKCRDTIIAAIKAENIPVAAARWLLPAHSVFQAKNGYGGGCPWSCHMAYQDINYDLSQWPISKKATDSCIQIDINGHRPPNGDVEIDYIISGIRKVFNNIDQIPSWDTAPEALNAYVP